VEIVALRLRRFLLRAEVLADARRVPAEVLAAVAAELRAAFAFERRAFAQPVTSAEVLAAIQRVDGVIASNLTALFAFDPSLPPDPNAEPVLFEVLPAERASHGEDGYVGAELLLVDPERITLEAMAP
jgi:hypothetical protein